MTAAYRMRGLGWFAAVVVIVLGFYLVSLQVATERNKLDTLNRHIGVAQRDIRALETEFDTRGNLAQLERWNGDTLALAAPTAGQFVADEAQLARIDVNAPAALGPNGAVVQTAALVVPSMPQPVAMPVVAPASPAPVMKAVASVQPAVVQAATAPRRADIVRVASVEPLIMRGAAARAIVPGLKVRPQTVALLDRNLLSELTLGDILSGARAEFGPSPVTTPLVLNQVARPTSLQRHAGGQRHQLVAIGHMRLMMLMLLFAAGVALIVARLAMLAIVAGPADARAAVATIAARGDIVDRNGAPLARTIDAWTIAVHPKKLIGDPMDIASRLAALMPDRGDQAWFYAQLTKNVSFTYLQQRASPALVEQVNAIGEPAIVFARETQRLYPQSSMAAHALGFLSTDGHGMSGMERVLDERLTNPALNGAPVALSIDTRVQAAMESELGRAMTSFQARSAGGVVLDVATGEVIAMVSLPTFNPNRVGMAGTEELRNTVTQSVYELGSTFKPITMAAAIDSGVVTDMSRRFDATAPMRIGGYTIHDDRGDEQFRWLNIPETLIYSSNIATARVADEVGPARMQAMFRKLGFDTKPDIELREKGRPLWPTFWARTTTMTTAYGHGIAVTPLHLASAYAALVNGGVWRPATLMKVAPGHAARGRRVISEATSARMRQMLRLIVQRGTGRKGDAPGYRVGGKTGTAEAAVAGGYDHHRNVATFAAAFPMDAPRYVVLAMMDFPQGTKETYGFKTAAWNAAPVVGRTIARVGSMLGVVPDMSRDIDESDLIPLLWQAPGEKQVDAR